MATLPPAWLQFAANPDHAAPQSAIRQPLTTEAEPMSLAEPPPLNAIEVRRSAIHGEGVFAARKLARGTVIGRYAGRRYAADAVGEQDWNHALTYVFGLADGSVIDGSDGGNATRYINHSCAPNCVAHEVDGDDGERCIEIEALRSIAPGAELFLDYALDAGDNDPADYACRCGAKACRGTLLAASA